jgi:nitrate/TMAO reductase-like tetraheme cytochrome c subunit
MQMIRKYRAALLGCCALIMAASFAIVRGQELSSQDKTADVPRMPFNHQLFATSAHCISCHSQVHAPDGEDISIGTQWRASVMANSARDPYWQASIRREAMDHPSATAAIEDKCSTCHMPMQRYQARAEGLQGQVFRYLAAVSDGTAMDEPEGELENSKDTKATLAADGVSCTVCHQIRSDNLGKRSSLDGGFLIDVGKKQEEREIFGPFDDPDTGRQRLMHSATGFTPKKVDYLNDSALCASCHTLLTDALDDKGNPAGTLPEQMPYQEWQHSDYSRTQSCQDCHMTQVKGEAPITSVHAQNHEGVMRHIFVGANAVLLRMLKDHAGELGVSATSEELEASAKRTEAFLAQQTAAVQLTNTVRRDGRLEFDVNVVNKTGHKLPTAYPARRAWLHVTVRDANGAVVFESGALRPDGSIVGNDNDSDPAQFEPHHSRITQSDQVEIYESIMGDHAGRVTTGLLFGTHYLKDNRILPKGFDKEKADAQIAVVGDARRDPRFTGGSACVTYSVPVPAGRASYNISVELLYESIGYRWAHNLDGYQAPEPKRFVAFYAAQAASTAKPLARAASIAR